MQRLARSARIHRSSIGQSGVRIVTHAAIALTVLLLSACGWRLQGVTRLPESAAVAYIEAYDSYSDFTRELRRGLTDAGARLTAQRGDAGALIKIRNEDFGQAVLTVSTRNIPKEYEVFYEVEYSVEVQGKEAIEPQRLRLTRTYTYDENALLAKQLEEKVLRQSLARDLAEQVLRRLASL